MANPFSRICGCALLQEIKNTKVQQKLASKTIADLQRNLTVQHAEQASEVASLAAQLAKACTACPRLPALAAAVLDCTALSWEAYVLFWIRAAPLLWCTREKMAMAILVLGD